MNWSNRINYNDDEHVESIPELEGVYEIQGHISSSDEYTRKYVGRTDDIRRRFSEHLSDKEPNTDLKKFLDNKKAFFRYTTTKNETMSKDIEKGLYDRYAHPFNDPKKPPSGSGNCQTVNIRETNN